MKKTRRLFALTLAMLMVFALAVPAFAVTTSGTCTVTFNSGRKAATYTATTDNPTATATLVGYQLMSLTVSPKVGVTTPSSDEDYNYAYTVNVKYRDYLYEAANTVSKKTSGTDNYIDTDDELIAYLGGLEKDSNEIREFANELYKQIKTAGISPDKTELEPGTITSTDIEQGYWLFADVDEYADNTNTVRSLVILDTKGATDLTISAKQSIPTVDKETSNASDGTYGDSTSVNINDYAYFKLTATLPTDFDSYEEYALKFVDTLSDGLDYDVSYSDLKVYVVTPSTTAEGEPTKTDVTSAFSTDYAENTKTLTVSCDNIKEVAAITNALVKDDDTGLYTSKIVVEYKAKLNEKAVVGSTGETNKVYLEYSNDPYSDGTGKTSEVTVTVYTYGFDVVKTDSEKNVISTAKFKLYYVTGTDDDGKEVLEEVLLQKTTDGKYIPAAEGATTGVEIEAGVAVIEGLKDGKYYLEETEAPEGYNKIKEMKDITISGSVNNASFTNDTKTVYDTGGVQVVNSTGSELPSTGGMGTTIFYVLGSILLVGAGIILITRRRMNSTK